MMRKEYTFTSAVSQYWLNEDEVRDETRVEEGHLDPMGAC